MWGVSVWMLALAWVLSAAAGYLLGSVNTAIVICKVFYKQDVRNLGSGNAGMTNVLRNFGKKTAIYTLAGDMAKGILAVWMGRWAFMLLCPGVDVLYGAYVAGIFAILGHMFPLYFGFKGGKGVAVSGGVILALQPLPALALIAVFLVVTLISKIVSLGSIVGISLYPVATVLWAVFFSHRAPMFSAVSAAIIAVLVVWMHRANIQRLRAGTEYKFGQKKPEAEDGAASSGEPTTR